MRNIHLNCHLKTAISSASGDFKLDTKNFNFHVASSGAVVIYSSGNVLSLQNDLINEISISEALQAENVSHDKLAGLEVTSEGNFILATQKDGVILSIGPDGPTVMGQVDAGIVGLSQSPDEELFLIVTDAATLIIMTRDFEPLTEVPLEPSDPTFKGEQEQINVGWGAKETQFHGSAGKTAAKASAPPLVPIGPHDDRKVRIAWKEDGQHFALSHVSKSEAGIEVRRIRIFNREGVLQSTSEDVSGLEHCLAWKPSGSLIASTVRLPNKHQVQFFEPNGLRHGEFTLQFPVNSVTVHSLAWNVDSTILMVLASDIASPDTFHLQLWTCSNYKWSLKKSWTEDQPIIGVQWDEISPFKLHFVTADSLYHRLDLTTTIDHSNGVDEADVAFVANVDGNVIGLTPFRQTVIPPPLNAFELRFRSKVSQVMFAPPCDLNSNSVMILTDNHELFIFGPDKNESLQKELEDAVQITGAGGRGFTVKCICLHPSAKLSVKFDDDDLTNFCWIRKNILLASKNQPMSELIIFKLEKEEFSIAETLSCEEAIFSISPSICGNVAAIQMIDGSILKLTLGDDDYFELLPWTSIETGEAVKFPTVCSQLKVAHCPLAGNGHRIFGLSTRNRLYCDDVEIATGINSFFVHSNYLLATTLSHTLKAVPLTKSIFDQKISPETFWNAESVRSVERGSRLIVSVPEHTQTVLQLPRGNLEVIHPRALALHIVKKLLNQLKYKETMNILRRERINLNLIVDHNPELFVSNIDKFVEQIVDKQRLCLFLSDLQEEDTTTTMYKSMYTDTKPYTWSNGKKVDVVCTMMQQVLEKDLEANFLPIISCLVRNSLSKNESALLKIQAMRETNPRLADEGLNFLLLLVDVQVLFDAALGLYDFDLVLFVTQRSQKDPKEYLQFLNELKRFPEDYRKFKIDSHLKKFDTALVHLVDCGEGYLEECLSLVMHHRLYSQALDIFKPDTRGYKEICRIYGDYLLSKKYFEDAALIYEKGLLTSQAIEAWEKAVNPSYCLAAAKMSNLSPNEMTSLYRRLVSRLVDEKRHTEASNLLVEYLDDVEEAVAVLVGGLCWSEAQRLISKHSRHDLSETHLIPKLKETAELTLATINRNRQSLIEQVDRLQRVMETKQKISDGLFDEVDVNLDDIDLYSDVTSHTGILSQQTRLKSNPASLKTRASSQRSKSSKNRRKHEKKKYSTREGSTFEDIALIAALHELITKVYAMTGDIAKLNRALFHHGEILAARTIQQDFENLLNVIFAREAKIWMESVSVSGDDTEEHKFGPEATIADIIQNNTQQKPASPPYHLLEIRQRFPPARPSSDSWKLVILSKSN